MTLFFKALDKGFKEKIYENEAEHVLIPARNNVLIIYWKATDYPKTEQLINSNFLKVPLGLQSGCGLPGTLWFKVSHKVVIQLWTGLQSSQDSPREGPLPSSSHGSCQD